MTPNPIDNLEATFERIPARNVKLYDVIRDGAGDLFFIRGISRTGDVITFETMQDGEPINGTIKVTGHVSRLVEIA